MFLLPIYDSFTITAENDRNPHMVRLVFWIKEIGVENQKIITKIGKSTWLTGVWKGHEMGMAGSHEEFLVWRFCFMWSFRWNFLFRTRRSSRHQDLGLCKYTLYKEHHQFSF